jgi:hypothetical protein
MADIIKFERRETPPPSADFDTEQAIEQCVMMVKALEVASFSELYPAYGTHLFIHLHDLVQRARVIGREITFTSDVDQTVGVTTVTDLISKLRNAVCHIRSPTRNVNEASFVFNRIFGYIPNAFNMNGVTLGCEYEDDVAIYYGPYRFYLRRHGQRVIEELKIIFGSTR